MKTYLQLILPSRNLGRVATLGIALCTKIRVDISFVGFKVQSNMSYIYCKIFCKHQGTLSEFSFVNVIHGFKILR